MSSSYLAVERLALQRPDEVAVHLVGSQDDGGHGVLVLRRRGGQQGQRRQRDVVLAAGEAALVVAVRAEAAVGRRAETDGWVRVRRRPAGSVVCLFAYFDTSEKASTHTAGQGTMRTTIRPSAAG